MLAETGLWDIRCPGALLRMFPVRRGYWFKVNRDEARLICWALSRAYHVNVPVVDERTPHGYNGWYHPRTQSISVHPRAHIKSVFHEWYHHLDHATQGRYDSSDSPAYRLTPATLRTGPASYAWQFAERLYNLLKEKYVPPQAEGKVVTPANALRYLTGPKWKARWDRLRPTRQLQMVSFYLKLKSNQYPSNGEINVTTKTATKKVSKPAGTAKQAKKASAAKAPPLPKKATAAHKEPSPKEVEAKVKLAFAKLEKEQKAEVKAEVKAMQPAPAPEKKAKKEAAATRPEAGGEAPGTNGKERRAPVRSSDLDGKKITVLPLLKKWLEEGGQKGTKAYLTRTLYKDGMTVTQFKDACQTHGGDWNYIKKDDQAAGFTARSFVKLS